MGINSKWWDRNWEILNGCSKVSEGCQNCFAESYVRRFHKSNPKLKGLIENGKWTGKVNLCPENLDIPLKVKKPTVWFVAERGDLFHEKVPFDFIRQALKIMFDSERHTFIILTKRPSRMAKVIDANWSMPNIYFGITAENQACLDERLPYLLQVPGKKIISVEPMLGDIDIEKALTGEWSHYDDDTGDICTHYETPVSGVICGGETGPHRRETKLEWVENLVEQCKAASVPMFVKQLSINGKLSKNPGEWLEHLRVRELPWMEDK